MKPEVLALVRSPRPAGRPLDDILHRLRALAPPPKSTALQAAEAATEVAQRAFDEADKKYKSAIHIRHSETLANRNPSMFRAEFDRLEGERNGHQLALAHAMEEAVDLQLAWRQEYLDMICTAMEPVRAALHSMIDELASAIEIFSELESRASAVRVPVPWIARQAGTLLPGLQYIRNALILDREIAP